MSEFSFPIKRSEISEETLKQDFCSCESAYCTQHGGHLADADYAYPGCDSCPVKPSGRFTMDWLGLVCDECARVNARYCHEIIES